MDWIEVNGTALRYDVTGAGPGTLVLVHEMGGTLESWDQVVPALARGRRVLRYDTRGAGQSAKIRGAVTFDVMAADLLALLDALGIGGRVALAGCAVGGGIVLHVAARHTERVAALVAMAPATGVAAERRAATIARAEAMERLGPAGVVEESFAASYPPEVRHDAERRSGPRSGSVEDTTSSAPFSAPHPPQPARSRQPLPPAPSPSCNRRAHHPASRIGWLRPPDHAVTSGAKAERTQ